ncbi:MAG: endopolygalacturonase [Candidatus Hydrogenedentes bacterium]|nr:endopolygalacturonase [Candidatus Hydrogenedentota bacterium]
MTLVVAVSLVAAFISAAIDQPYAVSVTEFGAVGNGVADDAPAIQRALDSPSAVVTIPEGTYIIGDTLLLDSGKTLYAHPDAVLRMADGAAKDVHDFLITNRSHDTGNAHISLVGGIWDGNNEHNARGSDGDPNACTGVAINFVNVSHLEIRDLTVRNPDSFSIRLGEVRHFAVENIQFDHPVSRPNQDGVHVGGFSEHGVLRNLRALTPNTTNDDMVALNADDDVERCLNLGMTRGPIRNIQVDGVYAESVYTFVRLLSETQPVENITIRNIKGGCRMYAINMNNWRFDKSKGAIRNVRVDDVEVTKAGPDNDRPLIIIQLQVQDLVIRNFHRDASDTNTAPTLLIANSAEKNLSLCLPTAEQILDILQHSTGAEARATEFVLPGRPSMQHVAVHAGSDGVIRLEQGSISDLVLNPTS